MSPVECGYCKFFNIEKEFEAGGEVFAWGKCGNKDSVFDGDTVRDGHSCTRFVESFDSAQDESVESGSTWLTAAVESDKF